VSWTIEAKAPQVLLDEEVIHQGYSYTVHPEVRGVYFALCNGKEFELYQTCNGPEHEPVLKLDYSEFESGPPPSLVSMVGPKSLLANFPDLKPDHRPPIGIGLRSIAQIVSGSIQIKSSTLEEEFFRELHYTVSSGIIERDLEGRLVWSMKIAAPFHSIQKLLDRLGAADYELLSNSGELSTDLSNPTDFVFTNNVLFAQGERLFNPKDQSYGEMPINVTCAVVVTARGALNGKTFSGKFSQNLKYLELDLEVSVTGSFTMSLV
jgi:hypothetical protein